MNRERLLKNFSNSFFDRPSLFFDELHQREEVSLRFKNIEDAKEKISLGWTIKKIKDEYVVRAPEQWLVDLTDPYKVSACEDVVSNFSFYKYLTEIVNHGDFDGFMNYTLKRNQLSGLQVQLLRGPSLETEIRVAGSDKKIDKLQKLVFQEAKQQKRWQEIVKETNEIFPTPKNVNFQRVSIFDGDQELANCYRYIKNELGKMNPSRSSVFIPEYIPNLFNDIQDFDIYLFIPWGSLRYLSGFLTKKNVSKIMFWEKHHDHNLQNRSSRFMTKDLRYKNVLIIDNSYTGGTLNLMSELVENEGGNLSRLALFPKSRLSFKNSEYVLLLDKIVKSSSIDISDTNWIPNLYKKMIN